MLEQRRLDYLQAMGIVQWMPRQPLSGAPQPRWLPEQTAHAPQPHQVSAGAGHIAHPLAAELLHEGRADAAAAQTPPPVSAPRLEAQPEVPAADAATTTEPAAAVVDLTPPRFELYFLRSSRHGVWVCDNPADAERMHAFAWRVMNALSDDTAFMQTPLCFRWPFIEAAQEDQSEAVALQALSAQWQFFTGQGVSYALCFGDSSREWLAKVGVTPLYAGTSLTGVMQTAAGKRGLWQALRSITEL